MIREQISFAKKMEVNRMAYKTPDYCKIGEPDETAIIAAVPLFIVVVVIAFLAFVRSCHNEQ